MESSAQENKKAKVEQPEAAKAGAAGAEEQAKEGASQELRMGT